MIKGSTLTAAFVAALFVPTEAWKINLPKATRSVDLPSDGWTPKPTPPPGGLRKLNRRQNDDDDEDGEGTTVLLAPDNTCGYVSGRPGAHFTCSGTYNCVFFTATASFTGNVACCDDFNCGLRLACVDYDAFYSESACDDGCLVDAFTLKCMDSDMPYCNTVSFSSDIYDYWCNSLDIRSVQSATTAYSGQEDRDFEPLELTDETASLTLTGDSSGADGPTVSLDPTATETGDNGTGEDDEDADNNGGDDGGNDGGGGGTPVGPIVGGVVGGVGAIGLGGLGLWLFFRNKKKKQAAAAESTQPSPGMAYAPGPHHQGGPPPPGMAPSPAGPQSPYEQPNGYYDPKFVAAAQTYQYPPQQQQQHPGGFHPMGNTPPPNAPGSNSSPTMSYADPNASSPSAAYPSGFSVSPPNSQAQPQGGFIHEAPSRPEETQRGGVHELA